MKSDDAYKFLLAAMCACFLAWFAFSTGDQSFSERAFAAFLAVFLMLAGGLRK